MPGAYGLSVVPPPDLKAPDPEADGPALAWTRTYYPGVAGAEGASKIVVLPGGEILDVELKLLAVPAHAVRGVVLNPDGTPAPKVAIALGEALRSATVESKVDGTFEFPAVAEGEWRFLAEAQRGAVKLRATEWIEVPRHDLENVKLRLAPPVTLRGKVVMDAPKDAPKKCRRRGRAHSSCPSAEAAPAALAIWDWRAPSPTRTPKAISSSRMPTLACTGSRRSCNRPRRPITWMRSALAAGSGHAGSGDLLRCRDHRGVQVRRRLGAWQGGELRLGRSPVGSQRPGHAAAGILQIRHPAIPTAITKFARCVPAITMRWPSPGTARC